ncbi:MAG: O-antigen ligase family protein [Legionella sp.]|nr:O-antigen ligase family protein [Legionella sp.]
MKQFFSEQKMNLIAPFFIVLLVFFVPVSSSLKSIFLALTVVTLVFTPTYRKQIPYAFSTLWARAALVFFLYIVLAMLWSTAPFSMRLDVVEKYSKLLWLPVLSVGFISPKTRIWALNTYLFVMLITCVLSLLKYLEIVAFNSDDAGEVFYNHIVTGFMVALAVYFAGILFYQEQINKWQRAYYLMIVLIGSYQVLFLNTGRTGYVIYALLMSYLILQKTSLKKAIFGIMLLSGVLVSTYLFSPVMHERVDSLISDIEFFQKHEENTSLGFRVQFHSYARSLFEQHPIIGIGTGSFKYRFSQEQPIPAWGPTLHEPHSQYWLTLTEQGLIGISLFLFFLATLFITALQLKETKPIFLGMLMAFGFGCFSDTIFCYSAAGSLLIIFSALSFGELIELRASKDVLTNKTLPNSNSNPLAV